MNLYLKTASTERMRPSDWLKKEHVYRTVKQEVPFKLKECE